MTQIFGNQNFKNQDYFSLGSFGGGYSQVDPSAIINGIPANTGVGVGDSGFGFDELSGGTGRGASSFTSKTGLNSMFPSTTPSGFDWSGALDWGKKNALDIAGLGMQGFSLYQGMKAGKQAQKNFQQQMALAKENQKFTYADALSRYENRAAQRLVNDGVSGVDAVRQAEAGSRAKLRDHYGVNPVA